MLKKWYLIWSHQVTLKLRFLMTYDWWRVKSHRCNVESNYRTWSYTCNLLWLCFLRAMYWLALFSGHNWWRVNYLIGKILVTCDWWRAYLAGKILVTSYSGASAWEASVTSAVCPAWIECMGVLEHCVCGRDNGIYGRICAILNHLELTKFHLKLCSRI